MEVLTIDQLSLRRGERKILRSVGIRAQHGELVALMGLSGGGKTTILRCIAGLEKPDSGTIHVEGGRRVGMVFQHHDLFEHLTALQNVTLAPIHVDRISRRAANEKAGVLLEMLGVAHRRDALPRQLSGGEAQRVAIARAMAMDPPLLLMDEPTASLDPARRGELGSTLLDLKARGSTIVVATHDDDFAREFADRVVILADGQVVEEGAARAVLGNPQHPATRALLAH